MSRKTPRCWLVPFTQMGVVNSLVLTQLLEMGTNIITHLVNEEIEAQRG